MLLSTDFSIFLYFLLLDNRLFHQMDALIKYIEHFIMLNLLGLDLDFPLLDTSCQFQLGYGLET